MFAFRKVTTKDVKEIDELDSSDTHGESDPTGKGEPDKDATDNWQE